MAGAKRLTLVFCLSLFARPAFSQLRSFTETFPVISVEQKNAALSAEGYLHYGERSGSPTLIPHTGAPIGISKSSLGPNPGFFVEALRVLPRKNISLLSVYNALEKIQGLKGRIYYSASAKRNRPIFTDAVRIEGTKKLNSFLPDPPPAEVMPSMENFYVRVTDVLFGHCYYEILLLTNRQGIMCKITNFKNVTYGPIPVMKEKTFTTIIYIEPVEEGLALYCLAGADVSDFILKRVDVSSALNKRIDVLIQWLLDGIR